MGRVLCATAILLAFTATVLSGARGQGATTLTVDNEQVTILRDAYGVPHVFASTRRGLYYGNGYAVAEDRLGQMELYRRNARGEMAEIIGQSAVASDRETRIDGYTEAEREAQFKRLEPALQTMMQAYADGVNRYLDTIQKSASPRALQVANFPGKFDAANLRLWRVTDTISIGQMMARRFGGGEGGELRNMMLFNFLRTAQKENAWKLFNDVCWRNDPTSPTTVPPGEDLHKWGGKTHWTDGSGQVVAFDPGAATRAADVLDQMERLQLASKLGLMTKWGSYCIAVAAGKSATGNALLVGGPQMGFRTPQIAHEIHISGAGIDCIGMGFAGIPGILIGHNQFLAWSTTTAVNDQTDVFIETLNPDDQTQYKFKGQWKQMEKRVETIPVAGGDAVTLEVFRTVHGPIVQWDKPHNLAYSRKASYWDRETDTTSAMYRFQTAKTIAEFGDACKLISTGHNFFCADQSGDIGFWFCGMTPIRDPRVDPRLPTPGDGEHEWRGIMKFSDQPQIVNPKQGFVVNWNNKPAVWWDNYDTPAWGGIWHSARIAELLGAKKQFSTEDLRNVLLDIGTNDMTAEVLLPVANEALGKELRTGETGDKLAAQAAGYLAAWDHHATEGSVAKTIFDAWLQQIREDLFNKTFGFIPSKDLFNVAMQPSLILHVLLDKKSPVPIHGDYLAGKTPEAAIAQALSKAVAKLEKSRGPQMSTWRYTRGNINFSPLPPIPSTDRGTYIQIVECAKPQIRGVNICPPGQSERTDSSHFSDQRELAGWFFFKPMLTSRDEIEKSGGGK